MHWHSLITVASQARPCLQAGTTFTELPMPTPEGLRQVSFAGRGTDLCCWAPGSQSALQPTAGWRLDGCSRCDCAPVNTIPRCLQAGASLTACTMPIPNGLQQVSFAGRGTGLCCCCTWRPVCAAAHCWLEAGRLQPL